MSVTCLYCENCVVEPDNSRNTSCSSNKELFDEYGISSAELCEEFSPTMITNCPYCNALLDSIDSDELWWSIDCNGEPVPVCNERCHRGNMGTINRVRMEEEKYYAELDMNQFEVGDVLYGEYDYNSDDFDFRRHKRNRRHQL